MQVLNPCHLHTDGIYKNIQGSPPVYQHTVITVCWNAQAELKPSAESALAQKAKGSISIEHVAVNGASTDCTLDIIRKHEGTYPMRWISERDGGMYEAIAKGFRMAEGDIFAWLNPDDMYMPWATYSMERLMQGGKVQWCCGVPAHYNAEGMQKLAVFTSPLYAWPKI